MISSFDLTKLNALLKDFYTLTQIRITIFDDEFRELAAYPEQPAPFCQLIRSVADGARECGCCDRQACAIAAKRRSIYTYRCHAGLTESIAPIILSNLTIGYLLFGHVFSYASLEEGWAKIQALCAPYHIDMETLRHACFQMPVISTDYIASASHILQAVAAYLCMERMVALRRQELPAQIDAYLTEHFAEELDAASIARRFGIGKTQLYAIAKQSYGTGIAEHIRTLRIEKARALLDEQSGLSLAEIAYECGFHDYNYFITVFKRTTGLPPKAYQSRHTADDTDS